MRDDLRQQARQFYLKEESLRSFSTFVIRHKDLSFIPRVPITVIPRPTPSILLLLGVLSEFALFIWTFLSHEGIHSPSVSPSIPCFALSILSYICQALEEYLVLDHETPISFLLSSTSHVISSCVSAVVLSAYGDTGVYGALLLSTCIMTEVALRLGEHSLTTVRRVRVAPLLSGLMRCMACLQGRVSGVSISIVVLACVGSGACSLYVAYRSCKEFVSHAGANASPSDLPSLPVNQNPPPASGKGHAGQTLAGRLLDIVCPPIPMLPPRRLPGSALDTVLSLLGVSAVCITLAAVQFAAIEFLQRESDHPYVVVVSSLILMAEVCVRLAVSRTVSGLSGRSLVARPFVLFPLIGVVLAVFGYRGVRVLVFIALCVLATWVDYEARVLVQISKHLHISPFLLSTERNSM
ncbi:hypothetical protein KIPB_004812 [Kipferlia bialata]|uniref:Uncharacterized protein n=1 Tax=Kipferlia bialata TaxID=797122 RepID=A0A9K3CW01_9EUKA|nr:hypothetical protein KIPB_004812 [Kipferlia bialata]|eukprot:g4812.t1